MVKKTASFATAAHPQGEPIGGFEIKKIVRQHEPVYASQDGGTFGQTLDGLLSMAARNGDEVQSITLEVNPEWWENFAANERGLPSRADDWS